MINRFIKYCAAKGIWWFYDHIDSEKSVGYCQECGLKHIYADNHGKQLFSCKTFGKLLQYR